MKTFKTLLDLLRSFFGRKKLELKAPSELPDEPEELFDDPEYDVEHVTEDDNTPRDPLEPEEEPEEELLVALEQNMVPLDSWKERQQALTDLGYSLGKVDGIPGRKTSAALRAFEKDHGLIVDGEWDYGLQKEVEKALQVKGKPVLAPMPLMLPPMAGYEDGIEDCAPDDAFFQCFIDLTAKSNIQTEKGRRRKGTRGFSKLMRFCWHQTAFVWRPYRESLALKKTTTHHKMNAHVMIDSDGTILLLHNFHYYLWTANAFNPDCISIEVLGNFEGIQGSGRWYKGDKFGRARPTREQIIRCRQFTTWLLDPEQGPSDSDLPKPLLEWREGCRKYGNPLKWTNTHREAAADRDGDCGSELWYHVGEWSIAKTSLAHGPKKGKGKELPLEWKTKPPAPPLPPSVL